MGSPAQELGTSERDRFPQQEVELLKEQLKYLFACYGGPLLSTPIINVQELYVEKTKVKYSVITEADPFWVTNFSLCSLGGNFFSFLFSIS